MSRIKYYSTEEINRAIDKALAAGDEDLKTVFKFDSRVRKTARCSYMSIWICVDGSWTRGVNIRFGIPGPTGAGLPEIHRGRNGPVREEDVAAHNAKYPDRPIQKREDTKAPTFSVQKYRVRIETDERGDPKGEMPGEEDESPLYKVLYHINRLHLKYMTGHLTKYGIRVRNPLVISAIQTHISQEAKRNPGKELANPILRLKMSIKKLNDGKIKLFDLSTKRIVNGKPTFDPLKIDGELVTNDNVHKLPTGSEICGTISVDVVMSTMGVSLTRDIGFVGVQLPPPALGAIESIFGDSEFFGGEEAPAPEAPPVSEEKKAAPPAEVSDDALQSLADDLAAI